MGDSAPNRELSKDKRGNNTTSTKKPVKGLRGLKKQEMGADTQEGPSTREQHPKRHNGGYYRVPT